MLNLMYNTAFSIQQGRQTCMTAESIVLSLKCMRRYFLSILFTESQKGELVVQLVIYIKG